MAELDVLTVGACNCTDHYRVVLRERAGTRTITVRVAADFGQSILAALSGLPTPAGAALDPLQDLVTSIGSTATCELVVQDDGMPGARIRLSGPAGAFALHATPAVVVLAAVRFAWPLSFVDRPKTAGPAIPEVFAPLLRRLGLIEMDE